MLLNHLLANHGILELKLIDQLLEARIARLQYLRVHLALASLSKHGDIKVFVPDAIQLANLHENAQIRIFLNVILSNKHTGATNIANGQVALRHLLHALALAVVHVLEAQRVPLALRVRDLRN